MKKRVLVLAGARAGRATVLFVARGREPLEGALSTEPRTIRAVVTVDRPVHELYGFWRNLENLPRLGECQALARRSDRYSAIAPRARR